MYTQRELPFLEGRSKPVISATYPFASVFAGQTSRPPTENTFTLSGTGGTIARGAGAVVVLILALMFLGRRW